MTTNVRQSTASTISSQPDDTRFDVATPVDLDAVNFYCFRGRLEISANFRALVIGVGDTLTHLAAQLQETDAQIVTLAPNRAARAIAQGRLRKLGLADRIEWIDGSLEDLPSLDGGSFDFVGCGDAISRAEHADTALGALRSVMKDEAAMWLQVPGRWAQAGLQQLRALTGLINSATNSRVARVDGTRLLVESLPASNWFKRAEAMVSDINPVEAALDNSHCFAIDEILELLDGASLHHAQFTTEARAFYEPGFAFRDEQLQERVGKLPYRDQLAAAELFWGNIVWHSMWVSTKPYNRADVSDPHNIPFFSRLAESNGLRDAILRAGDENEVFSFKLSGPDGIDVNINFQVVPAARRFAELADNTHTMAEIVSLIADDYQQRPLDHEVERVCRHLLDILLKFDLMLMRRKSD
ncbi:MAG: class I SAM-dependent methyltransferase [Planctomycetota bacterium]|nr:class I SAM-dependent methyltransferase [Planctomycetota bacterium]